MNNTHYECPYCETVHTDPDLLACYVCGTRLERLEPAFTYHDILAGIMALVIVIGALWLSRSAASGAGLLPAPVQRCAFASFNWENGELRHDRRKKDSTNNRHSALYLFA